MDSRALWNTIDFVLNSLVFIVVGLQLPAVLDGMRPLRWPVLIGGAAFVCAVVVGLRMFWIFPGARFSFLLRRHLLRQDVRRTQAREIVALGWSGLRGVLTLAAALSLPAVTASGAPCPHRQAIIFLAFSVILVTLVGQGLTLPILLQRLELRRVRRCPRRRASGIQCVDGGGAQGPERNATNHRRRRKPSGRPAQALLSAATAQPERQGQRQGRSRSRSQISRPLLQGTPGGAAGDHAPAAAGKFSRGFAARS